MPSDRLRSEDASRNTLALKVLATILCLVMAQGCTIFPDSPAAKLYALELPAAERVGKCPIKFAVREVKLPGYLDRPEIVLRLDGSRTDISAQHLWAAPLAAETTRLIGRGIQESLEGSQLMPYPIRLSERPDWIVIPALNRYQILEGKLGLEFGVTVIKADGLVQNKSVGPFRHEQSVLMPRMTDQSSSVTRAASVAQAFSMSLQGHVGALSESLKRALCP